MVAFDEAPMEHHESFAMQNVAPRHTRTLKWLWALQGLLVVPRLFLVVLVSIVILAMYPLHHSPSGALLLWLICAVDICMTITVITMIIQQYRSSPPIAAVVTLRKEVVKTVFATYLWSWTFFADPKCVFTRDDFSPSGLIPKDEMKVRKIRMYEGLITVIVVLSFYPALWMAWRDWRSERRADRVRDVEVMFAAEEERGLLGRNSSDTLKTFLSDEEQDLEKRMW